jgi:hypothetical protein
MKNIGSIQYAHFLDGPQQVVHCRIVVRSFLAASASILSTAATDVGLGRILRYMATTAPRLLHFCIAGTPCP